MTDTTQYKTALEAELKQITIDLQGLGVQNPSEPSDWIATPGEIIDAEPDENIAADRSEDWQERRSTLAALETRYNNLNRALKKIADDTYGTCEIGKEPISEDRLHANPAARTCKVHMGNESELSV